MLTSADERREALERVIRMEQCFDTLRQMAAEDLDHMEPMLLQELLEYYEGGQWLRDYTLDEQGVFPKDLKRGVLSQDGIADFLEEYGL